MRTQRNATVIGVCGGAALLLLVLFLVVGDVARHSANVPGDGWGWLSYCLFQNDACSTASATWAIAFGTFGAFFAAVTAAIFAAGVYDIEVKPRLGQDLCLDPGHSTCDRVVIVGEHRDISYEKPPTFDETRYWQTKYEFTNLGRLPLVGVAIKGTATFTKEHEPVKFNVDLGNIPVDKWIHLETYFSRKFGQSTVTWDAGSAKQSDGTAIAFHPVPIPTKGRFTIGLEISDGDDVTGLRDEVAELRKMLEERLPPKS